jgi:type VI protein secretion system component VasK
MITWIAAYLIKTGLDQVDAFKWARRIFTGLLIVGAFAPILFCGWWFGWCDSKREAEQNDINQAEIIKGEIQAERIEEEQKEVNANVKQSEVNFNKSINRDSGNFNGNFSAVKRRFCSEFPNDSKCR